MKAKRMAMLFALGGTGYVAMEMVYRGRSHVSMFLAGGICFLAIGGLEQAEPKLPLPLRTLAGAGIITMVELGCGLLFNRGYTVWDYRGLPGNFCGQICPLFSAVWVPVAFGAGQLYRWIDNKMGASQQ